MHAQEDGGTGHSSACGSARLDFKRHLMRVWWKTARQFSSLPDNKTTCKGNRTGYCQYTTSVQETTSHLHSASFKQAAV